jgi:hypothetical protein
LDLFFFFNKITNISLIDRLFKFEKCKKKMRNEMSIISLLNVHKIIYYLNYYKYNYNVDMCNLNIKEPIVSHIITNSALF